MADDEIIDIDDLFSIEKILVIVGSILVILSVFLTWSTVEIDYKDTLQDNYEGSWKGMEINDEKGDEDSGGVMQPYHAYPMPVMVFGILTLVAGVLNRHYMDGIMPLIMVTLAVLTILFAGMNYGDVAGNNARFIEDLDEANIAGEAKNGIGLFLCVIGSLIAFIGGIIILGKLVKEGEGDIRPLLHIEFEKKPKVDLHDEITEGHYITSKTAKRYHRSKCPYAKNIPPSGGTMVTKEEAEALGKTPCECLKIKDDDD